MLTLDHRSLQRALAAAALFVLPSTACAQACANQIRSLVLTDNSLVARKLAFSPNGAFFAYTSAVSGSHSYLDIANVFPSGIGVATARVTQFAGGWGDEIDFAWDPSGTTIYYTAVATDAPTLNRTSIRRRTHNGSFWGPEQVVFNPATGTTTLETRLAHVDAGSMYFTFRNTSNVTFMCRFVLAQPLPGNTNTIGISTLSVPNPQLRMHSGVTGSPTRVLCSQRNSLTQSTQFFTVEPNPATNGLINQTNVGGPVTQTLDDLRFASLAPSAGAGVACLSVGSQIVLHGGAFSQTPLTSAASPMPTSRAPRVVGDRICFMAEEGGEFHPSFVPVLGGGVVRLADAEFWYHPATPLVAPALSPTGNLVAYSYKGAIFSTRLDREVIAFNRTTSTGTFQVTLPCAATEAGGVFVTLGPIPPVQVPGFCGFAQLDPNAGFSILTAVGATTTSPPLTTGASLFGATLHLQGFRLTPTQNELTRLTRDFVF